MGVIDPGCLNLLVRVGVEFHRVHVVDPGGSDPLAERREERELPGLVLNLPGGGRLLAPTILEAPHLLIHDQLEVADVFLRRLVISVVEAPEPRGDQHVTGVLLDATRRQDADLGESVAIRPRVDPGGDRPKLAGLDEVVRRDLNQRTEARREKWFVLEYEVQRVHGDAHVSDIDAHAFGDIRLHVLRDLHVDHDFGLVYLVLLAGLAIGGHAIAVDVIAVDCRGIAATSG